MASCPRRWPALLALVALLLAWQQQEALARIEDINLDKDDRQVIVMSMPFGFIETGEIDVLVSKLLVWKPSDAADVDLERIGFFLAPSESETAIEFDIGEGNCPLFDNPSYTTLFTLKQVRDTQTADQARQGGEASLAASFTVANELDGFEGGELTLYYAKCAETEYAVSLGVTVSMYNAKGEAGVADYLSVGEDALPLMYMCLFVLFTVVAAMWTATLLRSRDLAQRVHWLMLVLVLFKALTLLSQAGMYRMISRTGHPDGWNISYYFFSALRGSLFFVLVVLIGTGWSYMRPFVGTREKRILAIVLPLQIVANVAIVVLDETTPAARSWFTWRDILHLVDIVCCCAVLFPIVWSIKHLRDASQTDGKAARCLHKLQLFRHFYVLVVSYIYFTRIVVYLLQSTMPYHYSWVADATSELATLAFYVTTGIYFRPKPDNPYLAVSDEDISYELELELGDIRRQQQQAQQPQAPPGIMSNTK